MRAQLFVLVGRPSRAFVFNGLVLASRRTRVTAAAGVGYGVRVWAGGLAAGIHFFSDTVSFFAMLIVSAVLHELMFLPGQEAVRNAVARPQRTSSHGA